MNIFSPFVWILDIFQWTPFDSNPVDCFLKGLVGACGVSVLYNLMRVHNFVQACRDPDTQSGHRRRSSSSTNPLRRNWRAAVQFWGLTGVLSLVGCRVSSLIVLEFSLRAVSALAYARQVKNQSIALLWKRNGKHFPELSISALESGKHNKHTEKFEEGVGSRALELLLIQSQFSLGCSLTCTLAFIHQGALHSSFGLLLAAALSWAFASYSSGLWRHVARLFPLHRTDGYCGKCINLLTSGHTMLASLRRVVILAFGAAAVASTTTVYEHFLSQKDAMKFWTLLTLCYTMLVAYNQEEQHRLSITETLLRTVALRLGGLLVLMLAVGNWTDVLHILVAFLGEGVCLLPSEDLLQAALKKERESDQDKQKTCHRSNMRTHHRESEEQAQCF